MSRQGIITMFSAIVACLLLGTGPLHAQEAPEQPSGLLLERLSTPLGIENFEPAMSWVVNHPEPNQYQTAYQIQVATNIDALDNGEPDV